VFGKILSNSVLDIRWAGVLFVVPSYAKDACESFFSSAALSWGRCWRHAGKAYKGIDILSPLHHSVQSEAFFLSLRFLLFLILDDGLTMIRTSLSSPLWRRCDARRMGCWLAFLRFDKHYLMLLHFGRMPGGCRCTQFGGIDIYFCLFNTSSRL
jgi:hypothetical protein